MQRLKIAAFSIAFLSLVCQAGCKSDDSDLQKSNITSIQDVTEVSEEKSTDTTSVDDPEKMLPTRQARIQAMQQIQQKHQKPSKTMVQLQPQDPSRL